MSTLTQTRPAGPRETTGGPPPTTEADHGGGGARWVELLRARNDIEAHLLTGRLEEAQVETRTVKDRSAPGAWLYGGSNPWAPVVILVKAMQLEDARLVLAEISLAGPAVDVTPAPPTAGRRHAVVWWLTAIALGLAFTSIGFARALEGSFACDVPILCSTSDGAP